MIDLTILGQPFWGHHIARGLGDHAPDIRATFIPEGRYPHLLARPPWSDRRIVMRVGYRIGATTWRGRLFDTYWSMLRRAMPDAAASHYWLGTDVLDTVREARAGTLGWSRLSGSRGDLHLAAAPWLVDELAEVGLRALSAGISPVTPASSEAPPMPSDFSILSYVPGARFEFYGGPQILDAARRLPDVRFDIIGRGDPVASAPPNVRWHGWVDDMAKRYAETSVVVRIPEHDALGGTVVEGLLNARHVLSSYEIPFTGRVSPLTSDALLAAILELKATFDAGRLTPNLEGRAYALAEFDEARLVGRLAALLRAAA